MAQPVPRAPLGPDCPPSSPKPIHHDQSQTAIETSLPSCYYGAHEREGAGQKTTTKDLSPAAECRQTREMLQERDSYPDDNTRYELFLLGDGEKKITFV